MSNSNQDMIPMLSYEDGVAALEWLCRVFGFTEKNRMLYDDGTLAHGEITLGNCIIMLATPTPDYRSPKHHRESCGQAAKWYRSSYVINGVLVFVDDVIKHFERAKEMGATILSGLEEGGPGMRYRVEDLEGQRWMFMQKNSI